MPACTSSGGPVRRIRARRWSDDGVERPRCPARAAGERAQVLDGDRSAEHRLQHRRQHCGPRLAQTLAEPEEALGTRRDLDLLGALVMRYRRCGR